MGHGEMLLAVAGLNDDEVKQRVAALATGDWDRFPPAERVGYRFAHALARNPAGVTTADVELLKKAFGPERAIDVIWYAAWVNYMTRVADAFQLPLEQENVFAPPKPTVPGVVIAHSPAKSKEYVGSPSLAVLPTGEYVASHDFFRAGDHGDTTVVYASADRGKTWAKRATVQGQWWSTLFAHRGALYLMGTSGARGHCVIRRSTDGGKTWTEPKDADTGLLHADGMYHCAPVPVLVHNGRLWRGMEDGTGPDGWTRKFQAFMMSAPEDADLLKASSWTSSNRLAHNSAWLNGKFGGWLEGNAVAAPDGSVVDILRVQQPGYPEKAAVVRVSADGKRATFDPAKDFIDFPGGGKKFTTRFDPKSKLYWSLASVVPKEHEGPNPSSRRNTLALISSADLRAWEVKKVVLQHPDVKQHGFQYADWLFDGDDIIAAVRTAWDEPDGTPAHNAHDANYLTFLRVEGFRR